METDTFKLEIISIENKLRSLNIRGDCNLRSKESEEILTDLYILLFSRQAIRYFTAIYQRIGASNIYVSKDIEDYLSEVWTSAYESYDPQKGSLLSFLTIRLQNRIIDDARKTGGMVGLPRKSNEDERIRLISTDLAESVSPILQSAEKSAPLNQFSYQRFLDTPDYLQFKHHHYLFLLSDQLYALSQLILHYSEEYPLESWKLMNSEKRKCGRVRKCRKYFYYQLFYSSDIISLLKEAGSMITFRNERVTMEAMHFAYTNFCTDRSFPYRTQMEITREAILKKPLAWNRDALPVSNISSSNGCCRLHPPIQNEVVRGFMERVEHEQVTSANISQMKKKYQGIVRGFINIS